MPRLRGEYRDPAAVPSRLAPFLFCRGFAGVKISSMSAPDSLTQIRFTAAISPVGDSPPSLSPCIPPGIPRPSRRGFVRDCADAIGHPPAGLMTTSRVAIHLIHDHERWAAAQIPPHTSRPS